MFVLSSTAANRTTPVCSVAARPNAAPRAPLSSWNCPMCAALSPCRGDETDSRHIVDHAIMRSFIGSGVISGWASILLSGRGDVYTQLREKCVGVTKSEKKRRREEKGTGTGQARFLLTASRPPATLVRHATDTTSLGRRELLARH
jgi:hypothetical protein